MRCGVGNYLKRWGFIPQKPIKRAYEQRPEAVKKWLDEVPAIEKRAKAEGAEVPGGDETARVNTDVRGRSYAPAGSLLGGNQMARVLIVLDGSYRFGAGATLPGTPDLTYVALVSGGHQVTKAHRQSDSTADPMFQSFRFDGATNLLDFDVIWLIGFNGRSVISCGNVRCAPSVFKLT